MLLYVWIYFITILYKIKHFEISSAQYDYIVKIWNESEDVRKY